jgi:hypothetical protein
MIDSIVHRKIVCFIRLWRATMVEKAARESASRVDAAIGPAELLRLGKERTDAMLQINEELLEAYGELSKAWLSRVQSEVEFWSELAGRLAASHSLPKGLQTHTGGLSHRLQMAANDGRRMFEDGQKITTAVTRSLSGKLGKTVGG